MVVQIRVSAMLSADPNTRHWSCVSLVPEQAGAPLRKAGALGSVACISDKGPVSGKCLGRRAGSPDQSFDVF